MHPGGPTTQAPGHTRDHINNLRARAVAGSNLRVQTEFNGRYRYKYYAPIINGVYVGSNHFADTLKPMDKAFNLHTGTTVGSVYIEDAGDWPGFKNGFIPDGWAKEREAASATRLRLKWTGSYSLSALRGDSQLASITVTGAKRFVNVARVDGRPSRGLISYSIDSVSTTRIVRFWAGQKLVAEGKRVGDGAITCYPINGSGLTVAATLTYSADLAPGTAQIEVHWPGSFQIHYSTSALSFPRTPEATVTDQGVDNYVYLSPVIAAGAYNWSILQVSDEGIEQTASIPALTAKTINSSPSPAVITGVTGSAAGGLTVNFTNGEAGCTYKTYYSKPGGLINFGQYTNPPVIGPSAVDATSSSIPNTYLGGYAPYDYETDYNTLASAFDASVAKINTFFSAGQTNFDIAFAAFILELKSASQTFCDALELRRYEFEKMISTASAPTTGLLASLPASMTAANWKNLVGIQYGRFLAFVGDILARNPGRYTLPNKAIGGGAPASIAVGTGVNLDKQSGFSSQVQKSFYEAATPFQRNKKVSIVVRATKNNIEETRDSVFEVELDSTGAIVAARPNRASVDNISIVGLAVTVEATILGNDAKATASYLDLYIVSHGSSFNFSSPSASVALSAIFNGRQRGSVSYAVGAAGTYDIVVLARNNTNSTRSKDYRIYTLYITDTAPGAVTSPTAEVIRGKGAKESNE